MAGRCCGTSRASSHVKKGEWNHYEIEADGSHIRTWINGQLCVDLDDPDGKRRGIFALQLHSGGADGSPLPQSEARSQIEVG